MKNLHRLGFPNELKTVKGRPTIYSPYQQLEMGLAVEMIELGLPPEKIVSLCRKNQMAIAAAGAFAARSLLEFKNGFQDGEGQNPRSYFILFDPNALADMKNNNFDVDMELFIYADEKTIAKHVVTNTTGGSSRLSAVNITSFLDLLAPTYAKYPGEFRRYLEAINEKSQEICDVELRKLEDGDS
ncbi:hypothetical protein [Croceicoccus sp. YJ47]|uniref:hypothetical protein n=1 Tax=Croceicoccus sp. YJ47 TaxID=2798724 RepID=UPI001921161F|nr:hypothetical protein [Croceicoccus sp. YJ47]QQN73626.1 hypothetical protein JD971_12590 [Croceicoccus sp. YJ47]